MPQRDLILLGPPGGGKGTHAEYLQKQMAYLHMSTGDILRAAVAAETELGKQAQAYMNAGELVPDELVINLVQERMTQLGAEEHYLLDGFPRTVAQAEALTVLVADLGRAAPLVIYLAVSDEEVVHRLAGRRMCRNCAAIYNVDRDGLDVGDSCPECGGELYLRRDDQPEAVRNRLAVYKEDTQPLIDCYQQRGQLVTVDGEEGQAKVSERVAELARAGQPK